MVSRRLQGRIRRGGRKSIQAHQHREYIYILNNNSYFSMTRAYIYTYSNFGVYESREAYTVTKINWVVPQKIEYTWKAYCI
jgi:hypothetical protein